MHLRKAKSSEHHSHIRKFLDNGKDPLRRLKSLRSGLEKVPVVSCKEIVTDNASAVFHVFYASFTSLEQTIHDRVQKGRSINDQVKELLDVVLPSLEKIIVFVPEKIHKRWQYNSTCLVIRKLLHPDNTIELRQYGIKLLVLWLQALQVNAGDAAIELFASAIPRFPPCMTPDGLPGNTSLTSSSSNATSLCERYGVYSSTLTDSDAQLPELPPSTTAFPADYSTIPGKQEWVSTSVLYPLCAASPSSTDPTLQLMEYLLSCLTNQVGRLKWSDTASHMKGFSFLFYQFKLFYLACLYQNFRSDAGLYAPIPPPEIKNPLAAADDELIDSDSVLMSPRAGEREDSPRDLSISSVNSKRPTHSITVSTVIKLHYDTSDPIYNAIRQLILKYVLRWIMPGYHSNRPGSILPKQTTPSPSILSPIEEAFIPKGTDLMRDTWFASRDNVNLLFEIFHKGFQLSLSHPGIVNRLTELYVSWVMDSEKPLFMQPPMSDSLAETSLMPPSGGEMLVSPASSLSVVPWEIISGYSKFDRSSICAGVQPALRMFVAHSSQLFLHKAKDTTTLGNQVESCNRIIKLYQDIAQQWLLDKEGWEYLLAVLLYLVQELLREDPPSNRETTLGGCLADNLLHTLFVCFVKASMVAELSNTMWDRLVTVISSLTKWREVVTQWKVVMRSMTQCLARVVYHLDLDNPPLQQIEETHHFRKRSVTQTKTKPLDMYRKPSFGDFRPRGPPRTRAKTANKRTSSSPKIVKAVTVDGGSPSNSSHSTPDAYRRRTSTPATISSRPAVPYSSETMPLYHRILSRENRVDEEGSDLEGVRDIGARGSSAASSSLETSHIVVAEESEVSRSPRSRRGYSKLKVVSEPPSEAVIENSHAVEGNLEPLSPNRIPALSDERLSSKESGKEDFKLINLTSSPRVARRVGGGGGLVISNEAIDEAEQTNNPENVEEEEQPDSPVVVASNMTDEQLSPLRRSRSEDANLFRQIKPDEDEEPLARSTSQQPNNRLSFTIAQSFSEFVPGAKSTGVQFSPLHPHDSEHPPLLKDQGKQPSTVYEESSGVEEGATEVPVSYFSPVDDSSPSREGSWTPVSAAVVWQRMLRMLGDVNKISQPAIHALTMSYVRDIWKTLEEIEANLGISIDNMGPPSCPDHMPPMMLLIPWVVKACSLSAEYSEGRKVAYKLLCEMVLRHSSSSPSLSLLPHFYHLLHLGLQPATCPEDELNVVVKASCQLFSFGLPGSTVLLHDCLSVCTHILSTRSTSVPRIEALTLLGSMQYLLVQYKETPLPIPGSGGKTRLGSVLRDNLTRTLFAAACKEPLRQSRCLALHQVGMLAYTELRSPHPSKSVTESMNILLASLRFSDIPVAMVAMDMLTLLVEVAEPMVQHFSSSPAVVLSALSSSLASSMLQKEEKTLKVIISLLFCLRDWVMALPVQRLVSEGTIPQPVFTAIFEVLHYAANLDDSQSSSVPRASSFPVDVKLQPLEPTKTRTSSNVSSSSPVSSRQQQQGGLQPSVSKQGEEWVEQIKTAARAVLSHLINQLGHFPFSCGAAQMSSVVSEYHDCPSLRFLNELSTEIFYLPRVQFLALNHSAIITLIEIPTTTKVDGVSVATFETRVIVRDVIGKHSWDCAILYGPDSTPRHQSSIGDRSPVLVSAPSNESLQSAATDSEHSADHPGPGGGVTRNPHDPPTWRSHTSDDILNDLLGHLESTSPECLPHPGVVGMTAPAPAINQFTDITEGRLLAAVEQQRRAEIQYHSDTYSLPCMEAIPVKAPEHVPSMFAFHHCRVFLSHLGLLSWNRRNYLDVLEKNEQLIRELKHLDSTLMQCRQTYKVAVLYVAHGQEDRYSVLCNNKGSRGFEEFVAGLGWEVDMETHAGYMGGLNRTFCKGCTLPYYATSSEEILFHVSTRMPSKGKDIEQVRHLGNDEIHIVWSEHWRDYRRTVFKTHFADVLIIIYPLPNNLFRVQINRKDMRTNVSFGPLFDGAVVDKACLPSLVRATAINASRALRTPLVAYRGRYPERFNIIQDVMKMKVKCSYEDFAQSVIHPIEFDPSSGSAPLTIRHSPVKQLAPATSIYSIKHGSSPETRWSMSPKVSSLLRLTRSGSKGHSERKSKKYLDKEELTRRPRSKTVEETMSLSQLQSSHVSRSQRHVSVPDNLPSLGISVECGPASPTLSIITSPVDAGSRSHSLSTVTSPLAVTTGFHLPSEQR